MQKNSKILVREEIKAVLEHLETKRQTSVNAWTNLIVFRLSCCCGLRVSEICDLKLADFVLEGARPAITVRKKNTATKRHLREVPLWWDAGTLRDLERWSKYRREAQGAEDDDPFVCSQCCGAKVSVAGQKLTRSLAARRWKTALRVLGSARQKQLSIHCGRHSFCSYTLAVGRSPIEVAAAVGHSSTRMTLDTYGHLVERYDVPDVFGDTSPAPASKMSHVTGLAQVEAVA